MHDLTLAGESRVAIAGDWHGNGSWVQTLLPGLHRAAPDVRTILHLGDFGFWRSPHRKGFTDTVDYWAEAAGIERILVTPGNHEMWPLLEERFAERPGEAVQMSKTVWALPRGFRFTLAGTSFMSFGGAASIDYADRRQGIDWWTEELPTDEQVDAAIEGGPVDVMLTHETIDGGTPLVEQIIRDNPLGWADEELTYSALSRARVTRLWEHIHPQILAHGRMHVPDAVTLPDGPRIYSLGCDGQVGNLAILHLSDLSWS